MYIPFEDFAGKSETLEAFVNNAKKLFNMHIDKYVKAVKENDIEVDMETVQFSFDVKNGNYTYFALEDIQGIN